MQQQTQTAQQDRQQWEPSCYARVTNGLMPATFCRVEDPYIVVANRSGKEYAIWPDSLLTTAEAEREIRIRKVETVGLEYEWREVFRGANSAVYQCRHPHDAGRHYTMILRPGFHRCTCPAHRKDPANFCKHLEAAILYRNAPVVQAPGPAPATVAVGEW